MPPFQAEAGHFVIGGSFRVTTYAKPNAFHRVMARLLLGWVWRDVA